MKTVSRSGISGMTGLTFADAARGEPKRARTRARLLDAAIRVIASRGLEAASIQEIAQAADVANGTFYLHFRDKEEIVAAVAHGISSLIAEQMDAGRPELKDAIYRVAYATQAFIRIAVAEPHWGWVVVHTFYHRVALKSARRRHIEEDVRLGIAQGSFTAEPDAFLFDALSAITKTAILAQLEGRSGPEAGRAAAEYMLRILGVSAPRAAAICHETEPDKDLASTDPSRTSVAPAAKRRRKTAAAG